MREIINTTMQPLDVAQVLGISKEVFSALPQGEKIKLMRLVYSGRIFQEQYNEY